MHRWVASCAAAVVLWLAGFGSAGAVEYKQVNETASTISFTYQQMGNRVYGTFSQFAATLDFDPDKPEAAHAELTIQLASIDAGSPDANDELQRPSWFDTATYPVATFISSRITPLGNRRYEVTGQLTLKGISRNVSATILLKPDNGIGIFDGEFVLKRGDFKIGEGEWAGDAVVSNDINIRFRVVAPEQ